MTLITILREKSSIMIVSFIFQIWELKQCKLHIFQKILNICKISYIRFFPYITLQRESLLKVIIHLLCNFIFLARVIIFLSILIHFFNAIFLFYGYFNKRYPKDPGIVPYPLATLKCSHALTRWTCANFLKLNNGLGHVVIQSKKKVRTSPTHVGISKLHYLWVFIQGIRTIFFIIHLNIFVIEFKYFVDQTEKFIHGRVGELMMPPSYLSGPQNSKCGG